MKAEHLLQNINSDLSVVSSRTYITRGYVGTRYPSSFIRKTKKKKKKRTLLKIYLLFEYLEFITSYVSLCLDIKTFT